jgi:hypothetical protein
MSAAARLVALGAAPALVLLAACSSSGGAAARPTVTVTA